MVKQRVAHVLLGIAGAALAGSLIFSMLDRVPTKDDGLRWFNEEFWVSSAIALVTTAISIGLTVYISYRLLNRQLQHELDRDRLQRDRQLNDLQAEVNRERRVRLSDGLPQALAALEEAIRDAVRNAEPSIPNFYDFKCMQVQNCVAGLYEHEIRFTTDPMMYNRISELRAYSSEWQSLMGLHPRMPVDDTWKGEWSDIGVDLAGLILDMREKQAVWEDTGVVDWLSINGIDGRIHSSLFDHPNT